MDRRKYLKTLAVGTVGAGILVQCEPKVEKAAAAPPSSLTYDRTPEELEREKKLQAEKFFDEHEMKTITVLSDIIIPKDEVSGSATDAKVPDFIEFIVKEKTEFQVPMRGGLRWLNLQSVKLFEKPFKDATTQQQLSLVDAIAYPQKAKPEMNQGVSFFNLMRNLTASGFYTSEIGVKDVGFMGNKPNQWNGVPADVLKQYGLSYTEKELKECVSFS